MGMYNYVRELWKNPKENLREIWQKRLIQWRKDPATLRIDKPTRIDRARALGYKAKPGYIVVRQRVSRGGHKRENPRAGRRPKRFGRRKNLSISYQVIAEQRANRKYRNCEVLNSYSVGKDGKHYWYEIILIDRAHPAILSNPGINWISIQRGRVFRGLTRAGKKSRGLLHKGN